MTAFLLTWKENGWPHDNIVRMVDAVAANGYVDEPWRLAAHKLARPGDKAWVLKQGRGVKGIFGYGEITGPAMRGNAGNGKIQWMAPIRFHVFVDPKRQLLIGGDATSSILRHSQLNAQASGYPLDDDQSSALDVLLASPVTNLGRGSDWTPAELEAIVADYFCMLENELAGQSFSKTEHRNALRQIVRRSPGSIERKHQNISAVLNEIGVPWINGYKPLPNVQDALIAAVAAKLEQNINKIEAVVTAPLLIPAVDLTTVFVAPPRPKKGQAVKLALSVVVRKFDPAVRDAANHELGVAGEEFVVHVERERLAALGKTHLAEKVTWVSKDVGDGFGYDITSYDDNDTPVYIEVKATKGPIDTPFFITENERKVAQAKGAAFRLYRVFNFGNDPRIYSLSGPLDDSLRLEPVTYRASIGAP